MKIKSTIDRDADKLDRRGKGEKDKMIGFPVANV